MNQICVAEFDDYPIHAERMIKLMDSYKKVNPSFKATLFGIPSMMKAEHFAYIEDRKDWLRLGVHGFKHRRGECRHRTMRFMERFMLQKVDSRYDMICKPPHYGYGCRYVRLMHRLGYSFSCRTTMDIYRWFDSPLFCPTVRVYCKYEQPYMKMFGHPKNSPFMFIPQTKKENMAVLKASDRFLFSSEAVERKSMIYLGSGEHHIEGFDNLDKNAKGATKWQWGERIPYAGKSVSFVLIQQSLMYAPLDMYPAIFSEIKRVLCAGGHVLVKEDDTDVRIWKQIGRSGVASHTNQMIMAHFMEGAGLSILSTDSRKLVDKYSTLVNRVDKVHKGWIYLIEAINEEGRK